MINPIQARPVPTEPVNRKVLGHFIESGFGRQVNGMWAEMIYNRAFRPIAPYTRWTWEWLGFGEEKYNSDAPFWHSGYEENDWEAFGPVKRSLTHGIQTFKGKHSLFLQHDGTDAEGGLRQAGLHVRAGKKYDFTMMAGIQGRRVMNNADKREVVLLEKGDFTVRFRKADGSVLAEKVFTLYPDQAEVGFSFTAEETEVLSIEICYSWLGGVYVSWVSLMPADNIKGWRRDVVELLREVKVPIMRFPGGCFVSFYDWEKTVGPRGEREPQDSHYWGGLEENDVGLDEICDLAEEVGFDLQLCFNMMSSTPYKARQMVEYLNAPADVGMGRLRALNGHPEPRNVKYFEMDNETDRKWTPEAYARAAVEFIREMRLADPSIEFMMQGYRFDEDKIRAMLDIAGGDINYLIHRKGEPDFVREQLSLIADYNRDSGNHVRLVNTEWLAGFTPLHPLTEEDAPEVVDGKLGRYGGLNGDYRYSFSYSQQCWYYALLAAIRCLNNMSYGGEFVSANFNNCCNTWGQNIIEASKDGAWLSSAGEVFRLLGAHFRENARAKDYDTGREDIRALSLVGEGETLYIVNDSPDEVMLAFPGAWRGERISAPGQLTRVTEGTHPIAREEIEAADVFTLPPWSVTAAEKR